jgi:hypothetical protein
MNIKQIPFRKRWLVWVVSILIFMVFGSLAMRGYILQKALDSATGRIRNHHYSAHWDGARFKGLNTVFVKGIYIQSMTGGNELFMDSVSTEVRILPLFLKKIRIHEFACRTVSIRYHTEKKALVKAVAETDSTGIASDGFSETDMADLANRFIRRLFSYAPTKAKINRVEVRISSAGSPTLIAVHSFVLQRGSISATLVFAGDKLTTRIPVAGRFDKTSSVMEFQLIKSDTSLLPIPLLREKYGVSMGFDTLTFNINLSGRRRHLVDASGAFSFDGFVLNGKRFSTDDIKISHFWSSFLVHVTPGTFELDSVSRAVFNKTEILPYFRLNLREGPEIAFKLRPVDWDAGAFFASLPPGMFTSLNGLRASGMLHFFLDFSVSLNNPDSLVFDTRLRADDFDIISYGTDDYRILNGEFYHRVYEKDKVVAAFSVGAVNPDYVPIDQISPFLRAAVMTSEDGSFFHHRGFNPGAFRESMITNIKEKRFARGGSTISMQLVKNVFLTRNKTLARKVEEALIVWLIENKHLVSKQRMFEVYLNIIEWGPGIYGINQASRFYFNKPPSGLNLTESVYLASIVPRPKWYKYTFESNGAPKPFFGNYFNRLKELMVRKEFINPGDTMGSNSAVLLTGPAAQIFSMPDTVATDSLVLEELKIVTSP